jgi:hypothetical protein
MDASLAFGKRKRNSLSHPVTPSELAFAAAEPPLDSKPAAPAAAKVGLIRLLKSKSAALLAGFLLRARQVPWVYPRVAGLAIATVLSFALTTAIILGRMPERQPADTGASEIAAADPAPTTQAGEAGGIRIVDPPAEMLGSCENAAWPYIDRRCFDSANGGNEAKREASKEPGRNGKIGPRPIDARSNPLASAQEQNIPIGSLTAVAPASPSISTTDGAATGAPEARVAETAPGYVTERAASTRRAHKSARMSDAADRTGSVKKKKIRQVADARRKSDDRGTAGEAPETAPFFPFGLFGQTR